MKAGYGREQAAQGKVLKSRNSYKPEGSKSKGKDADWEKQPKAMEVGCIHEWAILYDI